MSKLMVLVLTLGMTATYGFAADARTEENVEEALALLAEPYPSEAQKPRVDAVKKQAAETPEFRSQLVAELTRRLEGYKEPSRGDGEIRALRELNGVEALPTLLRRWEQAPRKSICLPHADPRVQLVMTLGVLQKGAEGVAFLTRVIDDEDEARAVRLYAIVTLCSLGDPGGIQHVLAAYERDKQQFGSRMFTYVNDKDKPTTLPWDQDADGMSDYVEKGLLLDPTRPDTDGDGIPDGSDRNPFTVAKSELSENQITAQYLFYLYATCLMREVRDPLVPVPGACIVVTTNKWEDSSNDPSLLAGVELLGVSRVVLALNPDESQRFDQFHGPNSTPKVSIVSLSDIASEQTRKIMLEDANLAEGEKLFELNESQANGGMHNGKMYGNARSWRVRVRKIGDVWLPVEWRLWLIT